MWGNRFPWLGARKKKKFNEGKSMTLRDLIFPLIFPFSSEGDDDKWLRCVFPRSYFPLHSQNSQFHLLLFVNELLFTASRARMGIIVLLALLCLYRLFVKRFSSQNFSKDFSIKCHECFPLSLLSCMSHQ